MKRKKPLTCSRRPGLFSADSFGTGVPHSGQTPLVLAVEVVG
jgi:hypothetical protein